MATTSAALVVTSPGATFERSTIERRELRDHDVLIDIRYAGICHSDIHQVRDDWGGTTFPIVPGHEIVGEVAAVGPAVTRHAVGDRVGVGCFVDSCRECEPCKDGEDQYCLRGNVPTYNGRDYDGEITYGGYSQTIVVDENYVLRVPTSLSYEGAAPLLCAGITVYSPLRHWAAGPGKKVAVVGLGGLGHMAVKIAHALGAEVTVLSQTLSKQDEGRRLGADHYYATNDKATFKTLSGTFDLVINTVSANLPIDAYLGLLRLNGTMVNVGAPAEPSEFRVFSLFRGRRSLAGSSIGGIRETQEMLDFCAEHGLAADVEVIGADQVDEAYERVLRSDVRFRFVIDVATLASA
ncbi:putative aldehyde dehydrogenase; carbonyl stress response [Frankia canadensis]|uniref:alcohol dehydrogenase (NADP(+)) n=1 Tax=Frankia canadensis TaxID=1836972 RepID=A0A2I2L1Z7_9ACTN|nr:NAD(P)-dependent alcohol dehydrogenase [Frankia canadensis]SNQ51928.1 putative aldehyde dehydrogenase; carbonyl stress response [Frankia canadensis]SOU59218.1 putative aldehyde dehydrogenase; carbonyl stress response [Frankia canadensis]